MAVAAWRRYLNGMASQRICEGQVALVTGASQGGTGTAIAIRLAAEGAGAVIAGGMGGGPRAGFAAAGIPVYFDDASATPRDAVVTLLAGNAESFRDDHQCQGH